MEQHLHHTGGERRVQPVHGAAHDGARHHDVLRVHLVHRKRTPRYVLVYFRLGNGTQSRKLITILT